MTTFTNFVFYAGFRPLSRYLGVPTYQRIEDKAGNVTFPSPLEVSGGSYPAQYTNKDGNPLKFPSPLEVSGGSY